MTDADNVVVFEGIDGRPVETLTFDDGSFLLQWRFNDPDDEVTKLLLVNLTEDEARKVFERDRARVGILEPVRKDLRDREATVVEFAFRREEAHKSSAHPYHLAYVTFEIPAEGDEFTFLDQLDAAVPIDAEEHIARAEARYAAAKARLAALKKRRRSALRHLSFRRAKTISKSIVVLRVEGTKDIREQRNVEEQVDQFFRAGALA